MVINSNEYQFEKVDFHVWQPTDYVIEDDIIYFDVALLSMSPCSLVNLFGREDADTDLMNAYNRECQKEYQEFWVETMERYAKSLSTKQYMIKRNKRGILEGVIGGVMGYVVSNLAWSVWNYFDPNSDTNTIRCHTEEIEGIAKNQHHMFQALQNVTVFEREVETAFQTISTAINNNTKVIAKVKKAVEIWPWRISIITSKIMSAVNHLNKIADAYLSRSSVPVEEMAALLKIPELDHLIGSTGYFQSMLINNNTIKFKFGIRRRSMDTGVYKGYGFPHWDNIFKNAS